MTSVSSPCVFLHTGAIDRPWTPEGRIRAVRITLGIPADPTSSSSEHRTEPYFPMLFSFMLSVSLEITYGLLVNFVPVECEHM